MHRGEQDPYSITSSARASSIGGISRPSVLVEIDNLFVLGGLHHWQIGRLGAA
jgi:hypothetical protein